MPPPLVSQPLAPRGRLPVHPRRLHAHQGHPGRHQPVPQRQDLHRGGAKRPYLLFPPSLRARRPHTGRHRVLVHIEPGAALYQYIHGSPSPVGWLKGRPGGASHSGNLRFVLVATVPCSRGSRVRLTREFDRIKEKPTSPGRPSTSFHTLDAVWQRTRVTNVAGANPALERVAGFHPIGARVFTRTPH